MSASHNVTDPNRRKKILLVAANPSTSTVTGWPVGFWWAELTHPWWAFTEAGYEVEIRSLDGGALAADSFSDPEDASGYSAHDVLAALHQPGTVIVNALGDDLHQGRGPSRYGRPGRIPGSVQVSAATLIDPATKGFTTLADARDKFEAKGVTPDKRVICYCGGGISTTIDLFLLHQLGYDDITLYDASMGEWARDPELPIETG